MPYLILSILFSTAILIAFRYFSRWKIDNLQAIVVNYLVAGSIGLLSYEGEVSLYDLAGKPWIGLTIILGMMFIATFFLFALSSQRAGVALTAVASRMSVIIPVTGGFLLFNEDLTFFKIIGLLIALPAIYLTFLNDSKQKFQLSTIWLPVAIFLGTGGNDLIMKYTDYHYIDKDLHLVLSVIFFMSLMIGSVILAIQFIKGVQQPAVKNLAAGILLGVFNFASTYFLFRSMDYFDSSVMFPVINSGIVMLAALADFTLFGIRLSLLNRLGIALAIVAIMFISMG